MKKRIPQSFIQDVVARTNIVPLVESRIELKKRGNTYTACCPFHSEKTPSFTVSETKQFYYCFGCGASGNAISFLIEYDRLDFLEALSALAEALNLTVPVENNHEEPTHTNLYPLLAQAQKHYQQALVKHSQAIEYLKSRGLTGVTAKNFAIGYAPPGWDFITKALGNSKKALADLVTTGMSIAKSPTRHYDRFRDRVIFPIRDARGRTIAFGGRTMGDDTPKYLNSPETPIFHKNSVLYGLFEACKHNRKLDRLLVVEGYMDVISLAQHGIPYAVATLGTALNIKHIHLLLRHTEEVVFCFDGDRAGKNAAWKALNISLPLLRDGIEFKFLFLPDKEDPDTAIQKMGKTNFEAHISNAHSLPAVFFEALETQHPLTSIANKAAFAKAAKQSLSTMPEGIYKTLLLKKTAEIVALPAETLRTQSNHQHQMPPIQQQTQNTPLHFTLPKTGQRLTPIQQAIQLLLFTPSLATDTNENVKNHLSNTPESQLFLDLLNRFRENSDIRVGELLTRIDNKQACAFIAALATLPLAIPDTGIAAEFHGLIDKIIAQSKQGALNQLIQKAKMGQLSPDEKTLLHRLIQEKQN